MQMSASAAQQLVGNALQDAPQTAPSVYKQPPDDGHGSLADGAQVAAAAAGCGSAFDLVKAAHPERKAEIGGDSPGQSLSQSPEPAQDMLTSQMEQQSVQLMHQVAMAVARMPDQSGRQLEGAEWAGPESVPAIGAPQVGLPSNEAARTPRTVVSGPSFGGQGTQPVSSGCIVNPLFKGQQVEPSEPAFGGLVTRIRATEVRLQEAILSLTEATQRFKQELPTPVPFSQSSFAGACMRSDKSILSSRPATQPHPCSVCQTTQPSRGQISWNGGLTSPDAVEDVCAPLCRLGWTPLNPLYPVSSRSVSPASHAPSPRRSPSPHKPAQSLGHSLSFHEPAHIAQDALQSSHGTYDVAAAKQQSRRERDSMFLPLNPVNMPLKPKASLVTADAMAEASRIQSQLAHMHPEPPAAVREGSRSSTSRASMTRPPNLPIERPSAVGSVLSESSTWSLEQPPRHDDLLTNMPEDATERLSLGPQGLREHYRRKSSRVDGRQVNKAAKTRGSMRVSIHPQAAGPSQTEVESTVSEPAESDESAKSGTRKSEPRLGNACMLTLLVAVCYCMWSLCWHQSCVAYRRASMAGGEEGTEGIIS